MPLADGDLLAATRIRGSYDAANPSLLHTSVLIETRASGAWTTSNRGAIYTIDTVANGSATSVERFRIDSDGSIKFNDAYKFPTSDGSANQVLKTNGTGALTFQNESGVTATSGSANQVAVFDGTDSIEGDSNFTWNGTNLEVKSGNEYSRVTPDVFFNVSETDSANLTLYTIDTAADTGSIIELGRYNGAVGGQLPLADGDLLAATKIRGSYDAANPALLHTSVLIETRASGAWTTSNRGAIYTIDTVANGSAASFERFRIDSDGSGKFTSQVYSSIANTVTPSALSATIDWNNGNMQVLDLQTGGSINTLTINNPKAGASYFIKIIQGGGNTITWPAAVKWAENDTYAGSAGAGDIDAVALTYDGTNYLANYSLDYQ